MSRLGYLLLNNHDYYLGSDSIIEQHAQSYQMKWPWILVALLSVLLILSLVIHVMQAVWTHRLRGRSADRNLNAPPDCTLAIASSLCYKLETSDVKLYSEIQEALHIYETLKQ